MPSRVALVTGANKGIGYYICDELLKQTSDVIVVVAARDGQRGQEALAKLKGDHGDERVRLHLLDVDQPASIEEAAKWVRSEFGGLDILINNAALAWKGDAFDEKVARSTISCNYYGTLHMCEQFLPLMRDHGRVINVASAAGRLSRYSMTLQAIFQDVQLDIPQLNGLMEQFVTAVGDNTYASKGWPRTTYGVSKAGVIALTHVLARQYTEGSLPTVHAKNLQIVSTCPGWCQTDMSSHQGPKTAQQGADTPVWLALLNNGEWQQGEFYQERKVLAWA